MLEFLNENFYKNDNFEGEVIGFNERTNKLIVTGTDNNDNEKTIEVNIFDSYIEQNINYYENWEEKIYTRLKEKGKVVISILSTESGDSWNVEIYRKETSFNTDLSNIKVINYIIVFCDEIEGKVLTLQEKYSDSNKEFKAFIRWINEQIEEVSEFNNTEHWNTFNALIVSDVFNSQEEVKLLCDLFNLEKNGIKF